MLQVLSQLFANCGQSGRENRECSIQVTDANERGLGSRTYQGTDGVPSMSLSDAFRDRHWEPGYVYIAGSLSSRLLKIGTTKKIWRQQKYLRSRCYGGAHDWILLYHVKVDHGGKIEHEARRQLPRVIQHYEKDGRVQRGRELVSCDDSIALQALLGCLTDNERATAWQSRGSEEFEFDVRDAETRRLAASAGLPNPLTEQVAFNPIFLTKVDDLALSIRSLSCLKCENINYVGDLVQKYEAELLRLPNFGRKTLNEIKEVLALLGLHLGVSVIGWSSERAEALAIFIGTPFLRLVAQLELSIRSANCLRSAGIILMGDLVQWTEAEMLRTPNFGRKSLNEIKEVLVQMGFHLGMEISGWPRQARS